MGGNSEDFNWANINLFPEYPNLPNKIRPSESQGIFNSDISTVKICKWSRLEAKQKFGIVGTCSGMHVFHPSTLLETTRACFVQASRKCLIMAERNWCTWFSSFPAPVPKSLNRRCNRYTYLAEFEYSWESFDVICKTVIPARDIHHPKSSPDLNAKGPCRPFVLCDIYQQRWYQDSGYIAGPS